MVVAVVGEEGRARREAAVGGASPPASREGGGLVLCRGESGGRPRKSPGYEALIALSDLLRRATLQPPRIIGTLDPSSPRG